MNTANTIYQEKDRSWIMNVLFYVALAGLILVIFAYGVFYLKGQLQLSKIAQIDEKIAMYGTDQQKEHVAKVYEYKKQIDDFAELIAGHKVSSNVFNFLEANTLPGVVFSDLTVSGQRNEMRLSGEAQNMAQLAKQFSLFEDNTEYVENISVFNSQITPSGGVAFAFNITLRPNIFTYGAVFTSAVAPASNE